jgi:SAM-dependent methyltransferase
MGLYAVRVMRTFRRLRSVLSGGTRSSAGPAAAYSPPAVDLARICAAADRERSRHSGCGAGCPDPPTADVGQGLVVAGETSVDGENARFWSELCGSQLAKSLGVRDRGPESLARFDRWYLDFYPYLEGHIRPAELRGARTLEVGLGYGTVSEMIARHGAEYVGLDVSPGPVEMVHHRLRQAGLPGSAVRGSILDPPFAPESFDAIIAIGCLHHTGDLALAIRRCRRLLRPGGRLTFMVYHAYSYRQAASNPDSMVRYALAEASGFRGVLGGQSGAIRAAYDVNESGEAAPHTDFISRTSLQHLCGGFATMECTTENMDQGPPFQGQDRMELLRAGIAAEVGLDLYATARVGR